MGKPRKLVLRQLVVKFDLIITHIQTVLFISKDFPFFRTFKATNNVQNTSKYLNDLYSLTDDGQVIFNKSPASLLQ